MKACILIALLINSASAQSYSGHSGWNFEDTRQKATDVVVADAISGTVMDTGSQVSVKATLKVVRTLAGASAPGTEVAAEWQYRPMGMQREAPLPKDPPLRGIWFWRKGGDGKVELLQATWMITPYGGATSYGGYYLPAGAAPRYYRADAPLAQKIANELAPQLEELVAQHSADLAASPNIPGPAVQTRWRLSMLTGALDALGKESTAEVYSHFCSLPDPWLKLIGINGRLKYGDAGALEDLEKNLPSFEPMLRTRNMQEPLAFGLDLSNNLPAAHRMGRLAIGETQLSQIESDAGFRLGQAHSPELLPYLITLLDSPNPSARSGALMGFCPLLGPLYGRPEVAGIWQPEMRGYCPTSSPLHDAELEARDIRFWKEWWASHREELAKKVNLPQVHAPARYQATAKAEVRDVPPELRFEGLVRMLTRREEHYHDATGAIVEGPMPRPAHPLLNTVPPADRETLQAVLTATAAKLEQVDQKSRALMDQARLAGTRPSPEAFAAVAKERAEAAKSGMAELQSRLSADGWKLLETFLKSGSISAGSPAAQ